VLGPEDPITVSGIVARESDVEVLDAVLADAAPNHKIDYNLGVLNPPVCEIEALLPPPQDNGMELLYSYGARAGEVGNAPFHAGENPVIDLRLPEGATGFLYAFYVDSEGQVFHLIPHLSRQSHTVPPLGTPDHGKLKVRLTYPVSEASTEKLGFRVVAPFGTNMVVAVLSPRPLFDALRPRAESIAALKEALAPQARLLAAPETLVVSRYLVTDP
jgi:serine/threonine-protein kinase